MLRSSGRVFLCDQSLKDFHGHCYAYYAPIRDLLVSSEAETVIVGHRSLDPVLAASGVLAGFSVLADEVGIDGRSGIGGSSGAERIRAWHEATIRADLDDLDGSFAFSDQDVLTFNTIRQWQVLALVRWLEARGHPAKQPRLILILHYTGRPSAFEASSDSDLYREAFRAVNDSPVGHRIEVWTDASTLVEEFQALTTRPVHLAPFPHTGLPAKELWNGQRKLRICYAGEARLEKGFTLLPYLIEQMLASERGEQFEFHMQTSVGNKDQLFFANTLSYLSANEAVRTYPEPFSPSGYSEFLTRADVLLIPYQQRFYHRQTSGIFAEARCMGVPVVVTRGTWMARELRGGGALCDPDDMLSLVDAVDAVCRNYPRYEREAADEAALWRTIHTPDRWVAMLNDARRPCD